VPFSHGSLVRDRNARELVKKERDATWRLRQYGISSTTYGKWKVTYELTQLLTVVPAPNAVWRVMGKLKLDRVGKMRTKQFAPSHFNRDRYFA
jgi:hypothetical protein